jgi:hypothetical protein
MDLCQSLEQLLYLGAPCPQPHCRIRTRAKVAPLHSSARLLKVFILKG